MTEKDSKCNYQWCWLCNGKYEEGHYNEGKSKGFQFFKPNDEYEIKLAFEEKIKLNESQQQNNNEDENDFFDFERLLRIMNILRNELENRLNNNNLENNNNILSVNHHNNNLENNNSILSVNQHSNNLENNIDNQNENNNNIIFHANQVRIFNERVNNESERESQISAPKINNKESIKKISWIKETCLFFKYLFIEYGCIISNFLFTQFSEVFISKKIIFFFFLYNNGNSLFFLQFFLNIFMLVPLLLKEGFSKFINDFENLDEHFLEFFARIRINVFYILTVGGFVILRVMNIIKDNVDSNCSYFAYSTFALLKLFISALLFVVNCPKIFVLNLIYFLILLAKKKIL